MGHPYTKALVPVITAFEEAMARTEYQIKVITHTSGSPDKDRAFRNVLRTKLQEMQAIASVVGYGEARAPSVECQFKGATDSGWKDLNLTRPEDISLAFKEEFAELFKDD
jgi:hypothetical protein